MAGDYTRFTFDPRKRYSGVLMQQGRVQLDADWNEALEIMGRRVRSLTRDTVGPVGVPAHATPDAFQIAVIPGVPIDLSIQPGGIYVDGWLAELFPNETATYSDQRYFPDPPPLPAQGDVMVYLDVWEREVTYVEDPGLLDVALGGADTTTRTQTVWQVKVLAQKGAHCGMDVGRAPSAGRLSTEAFAPPGPDDPCVLPPQTGYRGLENRLYRIEIHEGGALGTARFKWSRDNGSIVSAVTAISVAGGQTTLSVSRIGRDPVLRFRIDDWVTLTDEYRELHEEPGEMARVVDIDETESRIVLDRPLPSAGARAFGVGAEIEKRHTRVQRWDQTAATNVIDGDGLIMTAAGAIDLDDGIRIRFDAEPADGELHTGDYWVFAARTADASVEPLSHAPPRGLQHRYCCLAVACFQDGLGSILRDCRPRCFPLGHGVEVVELFYNAGPGADLPLHNGAELTIDTLARGLRLIVQPPVVPQTVNDASLFVTMEVPVLAQALFALSEISDTLAGVEVMRTDLRPHMLLGYQPLTLAADTGVDSRGELTWRPIPEAAIVAGHLLTKSFRHSGTETLATAWETFTDSDGQGDWRVNGEGVLLQLDHFQGRGRAHAVHTKPLNKNPVYIRASGRPHGVHRDFNDIGIVLNYLDEEHYNFVIPTYSYNGRIDIFIGGPDSYYSRALDTPRNKTPVCMSVAVKQIGLPPRSRLIVAYGFQFSDGTEQCGVLENITDRWPSYLVPGSRVGVASRYATQYEQFEVIYPNSRSVLVPFAPPRLLTRLTLKRSMLTAIGGGCQGPHTPIPAGHPQANEDFSAWFWLLPSSNRFGYEPYYGYGCDEDYCGIGSDLLDEDR